MSATDTVNRALREHKRYTGDGLPGEPVNAPLPVGDPQSGNWNPKKSDLRSALMPAVTAADDARSEADRAVSEANRAATEANRSDTEADRSKSEADRALVEANNALSAKTQAELAAQAAGAKLFSSVEAGEAGTIDGETFLVSLAVGTQVYENHSGTGAMVGWLGRVEFPTVAELKAWSNTLGPTATEIWAQGFRFLVAPAAEANPHLTTQGGVKLLVASREAHLSVAAFGILPNGEDETEALILADRIAHGVGATLFFPDCNWQAGEYYAMRGPIRRRAKWASNWNAAELRCIGVTTGSGGFFNHGNVSYANLASRPAWGELNAWATGDKSLTGVTIGADLSPGDLVWIEAGPRYGTSGHYVPNYGLINVVTAISGSTVSLKYAMDEAGASQMRIFKFTQDDAGMFCAYGADLYGLRLSSDLTACVFERGGGMLDCNINIPYFRGDSFTFGNAYMRSVFHADEVEVVRHLSEMAYCSYNSHVTINRGIITEVDATKNNMRSFSENCRDCTFEVRGVTEIPYLETIVTANNDALIFQSESRRCRLRLGGINAPRFTGSILLWWNYSRSSVFPLADNVFSLGDVYAPLATIRCFQFRDSGGGWFRNTLENTRFFCPSVVSPNAGLFTGSVVEPAIRNVIAVAGGWNISAGIDPVIENCFTPLGFSSSDSTVLGSAGVRNNASKSAQDAVRQQFRGGSMTVTSTSDENVVNSANFPPGSLKMWTDLEFEIGGNYAESGGSTNQTKTALIRFGGTEVARAETNQNVSFFIKGNIRALSDTMVTAIGTVTVGSVTSAFSVNITGLPSLAANSTLLELRAYVSSSAATIPLRQRTLRVRHADRG